MQYLYRDGDDFVFMDSDTYEQIHVPAATVGDGANYLLENAEVVVAMHEGVPLYVELPTSVVLEITYTEPGLQGDRSTGGTKPATVETGATDPGAAVHHHRREDQGRHPRRALPRPGLSRRWPARRKARKRALDVLYEADLRGTRRRCRTLAERLGAGATRRTRRTRSSWSRG